jgi:hypothetical protein
VAYALWSIILTSLFLMGGLLIMILAYKTVSLYYLNFKERKILKRKYGDLPMFKDFFRRIKKGDK